MNKNKISKILSAALSIVYITNSTPVFAQDITINTELIECEVDKTENNEVLNKEEGFLENEENESVVDKIESSEGDDVNTDESISIEDTLTNEEVDMGEEFNVGESLAEDNNIEQNNSNISLENIEEIGVEEDKGIEVLSEAIDFKDENLQKAINKSLSRAEDTPITIAELDVITELNLSSSDISDLSGLEYATALTNLNISDNNISNLQPITNLSRLTILNISKNKGAINLIEVKSIASLQNLNTLILPISDSSNDLVFDGNKDFPALQVLDLSDSEINNFKITNNNVLQTLNINNSRINDFLLDNLSIISTINMLGSDAVDLNISNIDANNLDFSDSTFNNINVFECDEEIYINLKNINANNVIINNLINSSNIIMSGSNINKVHMFNVNSGNCMYFDDSNIKEVLFENNSISYVSLQRGFYGDVCISNVNTLETIYLNDSEMENISLKQLPKLDTIYAYKFKTPIFDLSNACSLNSLSANNMIVNELIVRNISNIKYVYVTGSEINNFVLENLPKLLFVETSRLSGYCDIKINNCENINSFNMDSSNLKNINIYNSFNNGYFSTMSSTMENFNCSKSKIQQISINNIVAKKVIFSGLSTLTYLNAKGVSIESFSCDNSKIEYAYFDYNATVGSLVFVDSAISKTATFENITADSIRCENTSMDKVFLRFANVKEFYMNNGATLGTISLDNGNFDSIYITNANNAYGLSTTGIKVKNVVLDGFNSVSSLDLSSAGVEYVGLTGFNSLMLINISDNKLTDISCLRFIDSLYNVMASNNEIVNIDCIKDLPNLLAIDFSNNNISNIDKLKSMTKLEIVKLDINKIKDISALANCINLKPEKLSALNQTVELPDVYSKGGIVTINHPEFIDIDGSKVSVAEASNNGAIGSDFIAWKYDNDGILIEQITTNSVNKNFSVTANQKIIVDGTVPELKVSLDTTEFTNKDVIATVIASDELSGLECIYLPDGFVVKIDDVKASESQEVDFKIDKNGEYTFIAKDKVGNTTEKTIAVKNIDKEKPVVNVDKVKDLSNKKQFVVSINAKDSISGIKSITLPDGNVLSKDSSTYTFSKNGVYTVLVEDFAGNITTKSIEVKNLSNDEDNTDNNSVDSNSENTSIPNTGGFAGVISLASILATVDGWFCINKKKHK